MGEAPPHHLVAPLADTWNEVLTSLIPQSRIPEDLLLIVTRQHGRDQSQGDTCHSGCTCAKVGKAAASKGSSPFRRGHSGWVQVPLGMEPRGRRSEGLHVERKSGPYPQGAPLAAALSMCTREAGDKPIKTHACHWWTPEGWGGWTQVNNILDEGPGIQPDCQMSFTCDFLGNVTPYPPPQHTHNDALQLMPFLQVNCPTSKTMLGKWL